jgi:photosystem II stability/assembly factor-like uncharacterized protein
MKKGITSFLILTLFVPFHSYTQNNILGITGYYTLPDNNRHVIAATSNGGVQEIYYNPKNGIFEDKLACFKNIIGISGFYSSDDGVQHTIVATGDGNITEVFYDPHIGIHISQPALANFKGIVSISGFFTADDNVRHVIVATNDGNIHEIFYNSSIGVHISQPALANFNSITSVSGFYTPDDKIRHVIVATNDGNVHEIFYSSSIGVHISQPALTNFNGITSISGFYTPDDGYRHVIVSTKDGNIHEIFYNSATGVHISQPALANFEGIVNIAGFYTDDDKIRHVIVATNNGEIHEIFYNSAIGVHISQPALYSFGWVSAGPTYIQGGTGRVMTITFDPSNPDIIYCGTPSGGLWRYSPSAHTWNTLTDGLTTLGVSGIAINPNNANQIYILTGDGFPFTDLSTNTIGVLRSDNGGLTWTATGLSTGLFSRGRKLLMDPANSNILFAVTDAGIFRTGDGGVHWSLVQSGNFIDCQFKPGDDNTVYACTATQFWRSINQGNAWTQITSGLPIPTCTSYNPPDNAAIARIAVSPNNANYVYILFDCQGYIVIHLSTNSGVDFGPNRFTNLPSIPWILSDQTLNFAFGADPNNVNTLYAGGAQNSNLYKSTDGGASWPATPASIVHPDFSTIEFHNGAIFVGTDGGIYKSTDGALTFTDLTKGMVMTQAYFVGGTPQNNHLFYFGSQDNGSSKFTDDSHTNTKVYGGDGARCIVDYTNANIAYVEQGENLLKTIDGGVTMQTITPPLTGHPPAGALVMDPNTPSILYAGYTDIFKTVNGGANWTKILANVGQQNSMVISASNSNCIYTAEPSIIRKSADGGASWINITGTLPVSGNGMSSIAVSSLDSKKIWVTLSGSSPGNKVFESPDGGGTWINISGSLSNIGTHCISFEPGNQVDALYIGTDKGVYYRDNNLGDWIAFNSGLPSVIVNDLYINATGNKITAATFGRGLWTSSLYLKPCSAR